MKLDGTDDRYPRVPKPSNDEKRAADEINVEGTVER